MKVKIHFNRVNMQRGDARVWSAHTSKSCNMAEVVEVRHRGKIVLRTEFSPNGKQPRAKLITNGTVKFEGNTAVVEVL
jgi:hypothetical protein